MTGLAPVPEKRRILVVDDSIENADCLTQLLKLMGHIVHTVYSGVRAIEVVIEMKPEIVLLDIGMPEMNGYEVCIHLRKRVGDDLLIIAITGLGHPADRIRSMEAGFDHHLVKPAAFDVLHELLKKKAVA
ncbi:MAG: response regulator [Chthoniobacterales bacterium]